MSEKKNLKAVSAPVKLGIILLIIAGCMGLLLGGANVLTKDRIASAKEMANKKAYAAVLPEGASVDALEEVQVPDEYKDSVLEAFRCGTIGFPAKATAAR